MRHVYGNLFAVQSDERGAVHQKEDVCSHVRLQRWQFLTRVVIIPGRRRGEGANEGGRGKGGLGVGRRGRKGKEQGRRVGKDGEREGEERREGRERRGGREEGDGIEREGGRDAGTQGRRGREGGRTPEEEGRAGEKGDIKCQKGVGDKGCGVVGG